MKNLLENTQSQWGTKLKWFVAISLLFHLLFFYFYGAATHFNWVTIPEEPEKQEQKIVFEFEQKPKDVIETPDVQSETPPKKADLLSDKNMQAKNPEAREKPGDNPYSRGDIDIAELPKPPPQQDATAPAEKTPEKQPTEEQPDQTKEEFAFVQPPNRTFSRDVLLGKASKSPPSQPQPKYDNRKFSVDDLGGFAFNTYNWNFAPYLLYLKKRIQQHIFPPPAFTKMGIIEGKTVLRFIISRDGSLQELKVLDYQGHSSLMTTSMNAVNGSAPFRALPRDFPEEFLEVTGTFVYNLYH